MAVPAVATVAAVFAFFFGRGNASGRANASRSDVGPGGRAGAATCFSRGARALAVRFARVARMRAPRTIARPMTCFTETRVTHTVRTSAKKPSTSVAPFAPTSAKSPASSSRPSAPPALAYRASTIRKYATEANPSVAIMRGTLISRKTMPPMSATTTGTSQAARPNAATNACDTALPSAPACAGEASAIPSSAAIANAAIPTISRFGRMCGVARAFRRTRAITGTILGCGPRTPCACAV